MYAGRVAPPLHLRDEEIRALGDGGVLVRDDVLGPPIVQGCADALDALWEQGHLTPAGMGRARLHDPMLRGDHTVWASDVHDPVLRGLRAWFHGVREQLNASAWLGLDDLEVQLARYPGDGARYVRHRDAMSRNPARRATAIVYLNPAWTPSDGGCLRVHLPEGPRDLEPVGGRLVVFLAELVEHEVLPCDAPRRAATAWFRGP